MLTYSKYPFAISLDEYVKSNLGYKISLESLMENERIVRITKKRLEEGITKKISPLKNGDSTEDEVLSFYLALGGIKTTNSIIALNLFANAEANRASTFIANEDEETLISLAKSLGVIIEKRPIKIPWIRTKQGNVRYRTLQYSVRLDSYLRISVNGQESKFRLVNSFLMNGNVYLDESLLKDFLEIAIITKIKSFANNIEINNEELKELGNNITRYLKIAENKIPTGEKTDYNSFPPCMKAIKKEIDNGSNINHEKLLLYISFLISIGVDEDEISNVLESSLGISNNLSKRITNSFLGMENLNPYRCDVMKKKNLCPMDCGAKHPILAYKRNVESKKRSNN
ncbi:MAG: hypothetical protein ACP5I6_02255 [Caldisphaera sp.]|jgi:DNA primase large subunit|nr:MAG: hypothetical protein C0201_02230 [Caldisphaera sp.]PMP89795.1 MAG: hypothetical protein C0171_06420 [Caldisphaera sp.]